MRNCVSHISLGPEKLPTKYTGPRDEGRWPWPWPLQRMSVLYSTTNMSLGTGAWLLCHEKKVDTTYDRQIRAEVAKINAWEWAPSVRCVVVDSAGMINGQLDNWLVVHGFFRVYYFSTIFDISAIVWCISFHVILSRLWSDSDSKLMKWMTFEFKQ